MVEARLAGTEVIIREAPRGRGRSRRCPDAPTQPGPLALRSGIVYLTDQADGSLHAFPRESGRAVRIVRTGPTGEHQGRTARVVVTKDELVELDSGTRSVVKRPRLVPAELVLRTESLSETLALWYAYLHDNGILPTREVPHSRNVEATLRAQAALLAPYVRRLDPLMCALNRAHCAGGVLRPLREGDPLRIPDLPFERFADVETIELDGKATLGQRVDAARPERRARVLEERGDAAEAEPRDAAMNALVAYQPAQVNPADAAACAPRRAATWCPWRRSATWPRCGWWTCRPRSRRSTGWPGTAAPGPVAGGDPGAPLRHDAAAADRGHAQSRGPARRVRTVTAGWSEDLWLPRPVLIRPHVAVVEEFIKRDNPVFANDGDDAFALDRPASPPLPGPAPVPPAALVVRTADTGDHGTGVAWLIAGRRSIFGRKGLAPAALLFHVPDTLETLRLAVADAVAQHNVHVFNISAYWRDVPTDKLSAAINTFADTALFVVAAGNNATTRSDGQVCEAFTAYPVCWGDRKNVLVVTATNKDRTALLPPLLEAGALRQKGANWNADLVHVAAPGEGVLRPRRQRRLRAGPGAARSRRRSSRRPRPFSTRRACSGPPSSSSGSWRPPTPSRGSPAS